MSEPHHDPSRPLYNSSQVTNTEKQPKSEQIPHSSVLPHNQHSSQQQNQMISYYQPGRDPSYSMHMANMMAPPTGMLPPIHSSPMMGNVPIPQYMPRTFQSPVSMSAALQPSYYSGPASYSPVQSITGLPYQPPLMYPPMQPPVGRNNQGFGKRRTEIKRRTKTGCMTCRARRIKVCTGQNPQIQLWI